MIARTGTESDALATAVSVLGPRARLALVEATPGAAACIAREGPDGHRAMSNRRLWKGRRDDACGDARSLTASWRRPAGSRCGRSPAPSGAGRAAGRYKLRYAPRLDFLRDELTIPQRLEVFAQHGFDATEYNGLMSHPLAEVEEIRKKLDALGMEMGIFVANPGGWKTAGLVDPAHRDASWAS